MKKSNIQRPTSNAEHRTGDGTGSRKDAKAQGGLGGLAAWRETSSPEPELLPAVLGEGANPNAKSVSYLPDRLVKYHMAAERCGTLSVWCAAMAGAELLKAKEQLPHGSFLSWVESIATPGGRSITPRTAQNYMRLAENLQAKLSSLPKAEMKELLPALRGEQESATKALAILNLPDPLDVFNPVHDRIAQVIHHVTSGAKLTQLYFDWGICKPSKPIEPALLAEPELAPGDTAEHRAAVDVLDAALKELWKLVRDMKAHLLLHLPELKHVSVELMDLRRIIDEQIKRG